MKAQFYEFRIPLWKRTFDIVFATCSLLVLSPIFIATAIAIRLESRGRVFYSSKRVGTGYRIFNFYKFRSMYTGADKHIAELSQTLNQYQNEKLSSGYEESIELISHSTMLISDDIHVSEAEFIKNQHAKTEKAFIKLQADPRVTRVGRFIRKYSIDELPQLFNILKGDMSVVGNRPLPLYEAEKLTTDEYVDRFMAPAGLTGLWQVERRGQYKMSPEERKTLDTKYARTFSFTLDMKIILRTFTAFIQKENV